MYSENVNRPRNKARINRVIQTVSVGVLFLGNIGNIHHSTRQQTPEPGNQAQPQLVQKLKKQTEKRARGGKRIQPGVNVNRSRQDFTYHSGRKQHTTYEQRKPRFGDDNPPRLTSNANKDQDLSANFVPPITKSTAKYVAAPNLNVLTRPREARNSSETTSVQALVRLIDQIGLNGEAESIREMLKFTKTSIPAIQDYASSILSSSSAQKKLAETLTSLDEVNLERLLAGNLSEIPVISSLLKTANLVGEDLPYYELLSETVTDFATSHNLKFDSDFFEDLGRHVAEVFGDLADYLPGALSAAQIAIILQKQLPTIKSKLAKPRLRKLDASTRNIVISGLLLGAFLLAACGTPAAAPTSAAPTYIPPPTEIPVSSPTISPAENATLIAPVNPNLVSPHFPNLSLGESNGIPYGEIPAINFSRNNPNYRLAGDVIASRHIFYYRPDQPGILRGFGLQQEFLIEVFKADDNKGSSVLTGTLPDGTMVQFIDGFWQYNRDGKVFQMLANIANLEGEFVGYPVLAVDNVNNQNLLIGLVGNENGALLENSGLTPAFAPAAEIAQNIGFAGDPNLVHALAYDSNGNVKVLDAQGNLLEKIIYLDPYAPEPILEPTPTSIPEENLIPLSSFENNVPQLITAGKSDLVQRSGYEENRLEGIPPGTKLADFIFYPTGESRTNSDTPLGSVEEIRLLFRDKNGQIQEVWMYFAGYNFGKNKNGLNKIDAQDENYFGPIPGTPKELASEWVKLGKKVLVITPIEKGADDSVTLMFNDAMGGTGNELAVHAYENIEASRNNLQRLLQGESVDSEFKLIPFSFTILQ